MTMDLLYKLPWYGYPLRVLGFLWVLPYALLWWGFYLLPFMALGYLQWDGWQSFLVARLRVVPPEEGIGGWYYQRWRNWAGASAPCAVIYKYFSVRRYEIPQDAPWNLILTLRHEEAHVDQMFIFGPLFHVVYAVILVVYYLYGSLYKLAKARYPLCHPYYDHPLELWARKVAGQHTNWSEGFYLVANLNRWPWW